MNNSSDNLMQSPKVSLGCGTLILIALIVLIFSGGGNQGASTREIHALKEEVAGLRRDVQALRATVEKQNQPKPVRVE